MLNLHAIYAAETEGLWWNLNTSHVKSSRYHWPDMINLTADLNTSHVKSSHLQDNRDALDPRDLNTSHVKSSLTGSLRVGKPSAFKYISC